MNDNFIYEEQKQLIKMWKEHCEEIKQQRDTLQSNWNSLREWLEARKELYNSSIKDEYKSYIR